MTMWDQMSDDTREQLVAHIVGALPDSGIPDHLRDGLVRYFADGILPGGFLQAVLCNNLREAVVRANPGGEFTFRALVEFLQWQTPPEAWGSVARVLAWTTTPDRLEID
jgi:hypothetical protein